MLDKWDERYMQIAKVVGSWSSCLKPDRQIGAVITKGRRIICTGYNGAPKGVYSCRDIGRCEKHVEPGLKQDGIKLVTNIPCRAVHAEQNAICQAASLGISIEGATLYCTHKPCRTCFQLIINSGISRVVYEEEYPDVLTDKLISESRVIVERYNQPNS